MQAQFARQQSGEWVEGTGIIVRLFTADDDGDAENRHQRFVLNLQNGQTLLVAHNIEVAALVPAGIGDRIRFRGIYEWNDEGGSLHWTHRDPFRNEVAGYLDFRGKKYE